MSMYGFSGPTGVEGPNGIEGPAGPTVSAEAYERFMSAVGEARRMPTPFAEDAKFWGKEIAILIGCAIWAAAFASLFH